MEEWNNGLKGKEGIMTALGDLRFEVQGFLAPIFAPYGYELFFINIFGFRKNKGIKGGRSPTEIPLF